jgi:predicted mannosyl-3-phosphoglycerate phosphatase (HAD superfamily)
MIFKKMDDEYKKAYQNGQDDKAKELIPLHRQELLDLENQKNEEISGIKSELASMQRRVEYWESIYNKTKDERVIIKREFSKVKEDRAEIERVAKDMFYFVNQEVIKNNESLSVMGEILGRFTGNKLEDKHA